MHKWKVILIADKFTFPTTVQTFSTIFNQSCQAGQEKELNKPIQLYLNSSAQTDSFMWKQS